MFLLNCPDCGDIFLLRPDETLNCFCGQASGEVDYTGKVFTSGICRVLEIDDREYERSWRPRQPALFEDRFTWTVKLTTEETTNGLQHEDHVD